jgi:hypothetical protein
MLRDEMSVKSNNIYFHLGTAFMVLSIATSTFLLAIIWETSTNNSAPNNRYYDDFNTNFQDFIGRNMISICCTWGEEFADYDLSLLTNKIPIKQPLECNTRNSYLTYAA